MIFRINEAVPENPLILVRVQSDHRLGRLELRREDHEHALEDFRNVSQVELVVALRGRRPQVSEYGIVDLDRGVHNSIRQILDLVLPARCVKEVRKYRLEDPLHAAILHRRVADRVEVSWEPRGQRLAAATRGTTRTNEDHINNLPKSKCLAVVPVLIDTVARRVDARVIMTTPASQSSSNGR